MGSAKNIAQTASCRTLFAWVMMLFGGITAQCVAQTAAPVVKKAQGATLPQLYQLVFSFADHIEKRSVADEKQGYDREFYRHHLQKESGLTKEEYAHLLTSAQHYVEAASRVKASISQMTANIRQQYGTLSLTTGDRMAYKAQVTALITQRNAVRDDGITMLRVELGQERAAVFEAYLQTQLAVGGVAANSVPAHPLSSSDGIKPLDTSTPANFPSQPETCDLSGDGIGDIYGLCSWGEVSYLGLDPANAGINSNWVEFYSYAFYDNTFDDIDAFGIEAEGDLELLGNLVAGCDLLTDLCVSDDVSLAAGSPLTYVWGPTMGLFFYNSLGDPDSDSFDGPLVEVRLYNPDLRALQYDVLQGQTAQIVFDGYNTVSPFQNNPRVAISQSGVCAPPITVSANVNDPDSLVTATCTVPQTAIPGTYQITLSNGFGSDTVDLIVHSPPPVITNVSTIPAGSLIAGQIQTVIVTGTHFGTNAPTITQSSGPQLGLSAFTYASNPSGVDIVTFVAQVPPLAPASSVTFELQATSGSQTQSVTTSQFPLAVVPVVPSPQIMVILNTRDLNQCLSGGSVAPSGNSGETIVSAGQLVMLCVPPPPSEYGVPTSRWELDNIDDITGGFVDGNGDPGTQPSGQYGGSEAADPSLVVGSVAFYYVNPNSTETFTYTWNLVNGSAQASADFSITGPSPNVSPDVFLQTDISGSVITDGNNASATMQMSNAPAMPKLGIWFRDVATVPASQGNPNPKQGSFIWTQITKVLYSTLSSVGSTFPIPANASVGLDGVYPYPSLGNIASDGPSRPLFSAFGEAATAFDATMYVLWDPVIPPIGQTSCTPAFTDTSNPPIYTSSASTCSSIPIPLATITWHWSSCEINTGAGSTPAWSASCGLGSASSSPVPVYPQWSTCNASLHGTCRY